MDWIMRSFKICCATRFARNYSRGFTLIEVLAVITIIGLLASAAFVALGNARKYFLNVGPKMRLNEVAKALEMYKQKFGEYPPDCCATKSEIQRHILKRWPKVLKTGKITDMRDFASDEMQRTPSSALLFWLAGPPEEAPGGELSYPGFCADFLDPFGLNSGDLDSEPREEPLIELTFASDGKSGNYNNDGLVADGQVMAYFRSYARNGSLFEQSKFQTHAEDGYGGKDFHWKDGDVVAPYMKKGRWYNPDSYQLILNGQDGKFGVEPYSEGVHDEDQELPRDVADLESSITESDWDNITNFTDGATLESERE